MRLKTISSKRPRHKKLRACTEPTRTARVKEKIRQRHIDDAISCAIQKRGRRRRKNEARDVAIKALAAARAQKPVKPEFAA